MNSIIFKMSLINIYDRTFEFKTIKWFKIWYLRLFYIFSFNYTLLFFNKKLLLLQASFLTYLSKINNILRLFYAFKIVLKYLRTNTLINYFLYLHVY